MLLACFIKHCLHQPLKWGEELFSDKHVSAKPNCNLKANQQETGISTKSHSSSWHTNSRKFNQPFLSPSDFTLNRQGNTNLRSSLGGDADQNSTHMKNTSWVWNTATVQAQMQLLFFCLIHYKCIAINVERFWILFWEKCIRKQCFFFLKLATMLPLNQWLHHSGYFYNKKQQWIYLSANNSTIVRSRVGNLHTVVVKLIIII